MNDILVSKLTDLMKSSIVTYIDDKDAVRKRHDIVNIHIMKRLLAAVSEDIDRAHHADAAAVRKWVADNHQGWFNIYTGRYSPTKLGDDWVAPVPGDVLSRGGVLGTKFLQHWGIFVGTFNHTGFVIDVVPIDPVNYNPTANINLTMLTSFIPDKKYPMQIYKTIFQTDGGWRDFRENPRSVTLRASLNLLPVKWLFSPADIFFDQTCQSFVNGLIHNKLYTTQMWQVLYVVIAWIYEKYKKSTIQ